MACVSIRPETIHLMFSLTSSFDFMKRWQDAFHLEKNISPTLTTLNSNLLLNLHLKIFFLASSSYFAGCCPIDRPCRRQLSSLPHSTHSNTSESLRAINWSFRLKRTHFVSYFVLLYGQMWGDKTGVGKLGPVGHLHYTFTLPPPPRGPTGRQNTHRQEIMIVLKQFPNCTTMRNFTWIQTKRYPDLKKCHFQTSHRRTPSGDCAWLKKKVFF